MINNSAQQRYGSQQGGSKLGKLHWVDGRTLSLSLSLLNPRDILILLGVKKKLQLCVITRHSKDNGDCNFRISVLRWLWWGRAKNMSTLWLLE